jgi:hypothetical protein
MPLSALILIVAAAFIHAWWNLLVKRAAGGAAFVWLFSLASAVLYAPVVIVLWAIEPPQYGWLEYALILSSGILHWAVYGSPLCRPFSSGQGDAAIGAREQAGLMVGGHPASTRLPGICRR